MQVDHRAFPPPITRPSPGGFACQSLGDVGHPPLSTANSKPSGSFGELGRPFVASQYLPPPPRSSSAKSSLLLEWSRADPYREK